MSWLPGSAGRVPLSLTRSVPARSGVVAADPFTSSEVSRAMTAARVAGSRASSWSWMLCMGVNPIWNQAGFRHAAPRALVPGGDLLRKRTGGGAGSHRAEVLFDTLMPSVITSEAG
jgi:hypothetical protein